MSHYYGFLGNSLCLLNFLMQTHKLCSKLTNLKKPKMISFPSPDLINERWTLPLFVCESNRWIKPDRLLKWTQKSHQLLSSTIKQNRLKMCSTETVGVTLQQSCCVQWSTNYAEKLVSLVTSHEKWDPWKVFNLWSPRERTCDFLEGAAGQKIRRVKVVITVLSRSLRIWRLAKCIFVTSVKDVSYGVSGFCLSFVLCFSLSLECP